MKHIKTGRQRKQFALLAKTPSAQAAAMTLQPSATSDAEIGNEHPASEQWLFVVSGTGRATVGSCGRLRQVKLAANSPLLIGKGERHQIKNTGRRPLVTLNFYIPPAYNAAGQPLGR